MSSLSVQQWPVPQAAQYGDSTFPFAYKCQPGGDMESVCGWVSERREALLELMAQHGAVLLRDFPIGSPEDFDAVLHALAVENFPYARSLSNAVRVNFTERVFSANEAPASVKIYLHHEMAQTPLFPTRIFFYCQTAAEQGGATPLCRSDVLYDRIAASFPEFVTALAEKGLKYSNVMPGVDDPQSGMGRSWQSTLGVQQTADAERRLEELGYSYQWLDDQCLRATTPVLPAIRTLPDGRKTLFNQLIAAFAGWKDERNDPSSAIRHGDETPLDSQAVGRLIDEAEALSFDVPWQAGDVALIDNTLVMHGRRPFQGTRKVLASLADMQTHAFACS